MATLTTDFDPCHGFLPQNDPLKRLPDSFSRWEEVAQQLPKRLLSSQFRTQLEALPPFPVTKLSDQPQYERAMLILSFLAHAYVWGNKDIRHSLPSTLAHPWYQVAHTLGRPPVLSYASYALHNWYRFDPQQPATLGNIALLQNFWGGVDEEWFILIHIDIETRAIPAIAAMQPAQQAVEDSNPAALTTALLNIHKALQGMYRTLERMPEYCNPTAYYHRVRPFIHGWNNNPSLPDGLYYEGVAAYQQQPQKFRGETGAQSTIIPALDALLNITHEDDPLKAYLLEMRDYMPPQHREFLSQLEKETGLRDYIIKTKNKELTAAYNHCVKKVEAFRTLHLQYAARYIHQQSQSDSANPTDIGTGGTPFMKYLAKHRHESEKFLIDA